MAAALEEALSRLHAVRSSGVEEDAKLCVVDVKDALQNVPAADADARAQTFAALFDEARRGPFSRCVACMRCRVACAR
jgi:hypothetical protein